MDVNRGNNDMCEISNKYTPRLVVERGLKFSIPLYQRLFEWGKKQVKQLMVDLKENFEKTNSDYYIGMLTKVEQVNSDSVKFDLVDGQQRFVVMMLIGTVLYQYYESWLEFLNNGDRVVFVARNKDQEDIKRLIKATIVKEEEIEISNENIRIAYDCISKFMIDNFDEEGRKRFSKYVYNRLTFFFSDLPINYAKNPSSLNKYFEVMNSSGKNLEQHEILKVQLLKNANNPKDLLEIWNLVSQMDRLVVHGCSDDMNLLCEKYEAAIKACRENNYRVAYSCCIESKNDIKQENVSIGEIESQKYKFNAMGFVYREGSLISFSEFLLMILKIELDKLGSNDSENDSDSFYRVNKLIERFNENKGRIDISDFYNHLLYYRLLLDYYVVRKEYDNKDGYYSLLFKGDKENEDKKCLLQYQSMLNVSYSSQFYNWLKPYLVAIDKNKDADEIDSLWLYNKLREIDDNRHNESCNGLPKLSEMYYNNFSRYWFWRLDFHLWEYRRLLPISQQKVIEKYVFRENRSVEHLHPQDQSQNETWSWEDVNSFGNLAMISQGFNSQQSNDPVHLKFARIEDQIKKNTLQSIKLYMMYLAAKGSDNGWSKELSHEHGKLMYIFLELCYNHQEIPENYFSEGKYCEK